MEEPKTEKLSYYQRNRAKILEKRRIQREQKRRLVLNKQLENIMLDDMPKLVIPFTEPVADPVVEQFAERVVEPVVAEFAERTEANFVVSIIEPVIEPLEPVDKKKKTKKTKTI